MNSPEQVASDGLGNVFVANYGGAGGTVGEHTVSGTAVNASLIRGLNGPIGLLVVVPEPSAGCLGLLGLSALALQGRRWS